MLSMILFVVSVLVLGGFGLASGPDTSPWLLALSSPFLRWECATLQGTPHLIDALLRAPSILVPALLCSWTQRLTMPQRLSRLFTLHVIWNLIFGFLLMQAGVRLSAPF